MAFEDESPLERAYRYRLEWKSMGCGVLFFALVGAGGLGLGQVGCGQVRNGNAALGYAALVGALVTAPVLLLVPFGIVYSVLRLIRPPLVRVTPTALLLPDDARGQPLEKDERGNPNTAGPRTHPQEIPFTAIRWIRRETGATPGNDRLVIVHDLSATTLELHQNMMRPADFDELETVLRAAVPEAFVALPVPTSPGPTDGD